MLRLTQKEGRAIVFPSLGITVSIEAVHGRTVELGIHCDRSIPCYRSEILESYRELAEKFPLYRKESCK